MADSSLTAIQNKIRLITRSVSEAQLTDAQLNQYINTFVLYDFPERLRLFNLRTTITWYTLPNIDTYSTTTNPLSPLYDFTNKYITVDPLVYIAGFNVMFHESRVAFYAQYPFLNSVAAIPKCGDGMTPDFSGQINTAQTFIPPNTQQYYPLLQNQVLFTSIDSNQNSVTMADSPILDIVSLNPTNFGLLYNPLVLPAAQQPVLKLAAPYKSAVGFPTTNYINYITGEYTVTFPTAPAAGQPINSQTVMVAPMVPKSMLFFDGEFVLRPVPDQSYRVDIEVLAQPAELLLSNQKPELSEWWQYIAYGAAIKILEDRVDYDTINLIRPSFREQELLIEARTYQQQQSQATATIYDRPKGYGYGYGWGWGGNSGL